MSSSTPRESPTAQAHLTVVTSVVPAIEGIQHMRDARVWMSVSDATRAANTAWKSAQAQVLGLNSTVA